MDRAPCGGGGNVTVEGTILDQPPSQPNGGGFNSTLSVPSVTPGAPLAPGASVDLRFLLRMQQTGAVRFAVVAEGSPTGGGVFEYCDGAGCPLPPGPDPAPIPTMSEWAMILFGTILAGGAALAIQRRRRFV